MQLTMLDEYVFPGSVHDAIEILKRYSGEARIIAGGTDLIPQLKARTRNVGCLVDISRIKELNYITMSGNVIKIGPVVTHADLASSQLIGKHATALYEAAFAVGSPLIRNQGTIAGNVVNAQPAADTAVALCAFNAQVEITTFNDIKTMSIDKLYAGIGISKVDSTSELITTISFNCLDNQGSSFQRLSQRKALALPMLNVAAVVTLDRTHFTEVRIAIAPVAPLPFRACKAEATLKGATINSKAINEAADLAAKEAQPRDSALRGSAEYRHEMVAVLVRRALNQAVQRARAEHKS